MRFRDAERADRVAMPPYSIGISPYSIVIKSISIDLPRHSTPISPHSIAISPYRIGISPSSIGISPFTNGLGRCRNELSAYRRPPSGGEICGRMLRVWRGANRELRPALDGGAPRGPDGVARRDVVRGKQVVEKRARPIATRARHSPTPAPRWKCQRSTATDRRVPSARR